MISDENDFTILVVDDAPDTVEIISRILSNAGYEMYTAGRVEEALGFLKTHSVDLVITDYRMPGPSGLDLIHYIGENHREINVIMVTGYATVEGAVEAMKAGAHEYISKPFTDDELLTVVDRVKKAAMSRRVLNDSTRTEEYPIRGFIGTSHPMRHVYDAIVKASRAAATVLIQGESGTGKELVARAIHYNGVRSSASFVTVNCGGIPEGLLESELFGHVKGSFTGAVETRAGFFQTADGGTIFLDEISEMSLSMQVKLLRVLETREICMVGSTRPRKIDVRIIAATNKDLSRMMEHDQFREDLYYRLNVIPIDLPPLRDRGDDILLLINRFVQDFSKESGRKPPRLTDDVLNVLRNYHWPGNVRELQNVIHRLIIMTDHEVIDVPDLPALMRCGPPRTENVTRRLDEMEKEYIKAVLASVGGNKTKAASILGIDRKTLRKKLDSHDSR